ncbi:MAG: hypothetical protein Fur0015_05350 [Ignavibacteriales bacterium]
MRKRILTFVFLTFSAMNLFSQTQVDSANIVREILKQQILVAKQKQEASQSRTEIFTKQMQPVTEETKSVKKPVSFVFNPLMIKMTILFLASVIVFSVVFIRRKKLEEIKKKQELKSNIKKIRSEQLVVSIDPRLKAIRKKLVLNSSFLNTNNATKIIRENKLAVSEIELAAKLRQYETAVLERGEL